MGIMRRLPRGPVFPPLHTSLPCGWVKNSRPSESWPLFGTPNKKDCAQSQVVWKPMAKKMEPVNQSTQQKTNPASSTDAKPTSPSLELVR